MLAFQYDKRSETLAFPGYNYEGDFEEKQVVELKKRLLC